MERTIDRLKHGCAGVMVFLALALFASCAPSKAQSRRIIRPPESAAHVRVQRALLHAEQRLTADQWHLLSVRHNPSYCDSPAWEAHMYGGWRRVQLEPARSKADAQLEQLWLRALNQTYQSDQGWRYPTFEWRSVDDAP